MNTTTGYRFYLEYASTHDRRTGHDTGNVIAVDSTSRHVEYWYTDTSTNSRRYHTVYDAIGVVPVHPERNCNQLASTSVSAEYLSEHCKRISKETAKHIHAAMFQSPYFSE